MSRESQKRKSDEIGEGCCSGVHSEQQHGVMDPTKKELYTAKRSSGVDLTDPAISEEWEKVKSDNSGEVRSFPAMHIMT